MITSSSVWKLDNLNGIKSLFAEANPIVGKRERIVLDACTSNALACADAPWGPALPQLLRRSTSFPHIQQSTSFLLKAPLLAAVLGRMPLALGWVRCRFEQQPAAAPGALEKVVYLWLTTLEELLLLLLLLQLRLLLLLQKSPPAAAPAAVCTPPGVSSVG